MLVLLSAVALPDRLDEGLDLAAYYQNNRRDMWSLIVLAGIHMEGQWLYRVAATSSTVGEFFSHAPGDMVAWIIIVVAMIFVRRWWLVAAGFAVLSLGPLAWLSRTI